jgi:hypothetical protein
VNFLTWMFVATGVLMVALGIPMAQRRVPPNPWYGFRVPKTLAAGNERLWYDANAYSGKWLIGVGLVQTAAAVVLRGVPGINKDSYSWAVLAVLMTALAVMIADTFRYLRTL